MKKLKKMLSMVLAVAMMLTMAAALTGCGEETPQQTDAATEPSVSGGNAVYTINVKTAGGMALPDMDVYIYTDSTLQDLEKFGRTDKNGNLTIEMAAGGSYAFTLSAPKGYQVAESYSFNGTSANITLESALVQGESLSSAMLELGDVMYDFSVVTPAGETVTLSEMLQEKDVVLLNFWYTTCSWCITEFPFMQQAYEMYQDQVGIIALDPFDADGDIAQFQAQMGLTFPMASCQPTWAAAFNVQGYPTSVLVDRYGVICAIESGGITSLRPFEMTFDHFVAEDYQQKLCYNGIADLITVIKPTETMPSSEEISAAINSGDITVTYRAEEETDDCWPFVITEKNGQTCIKATNSAVEDSWAIIYADVTLKAGQAVGFDYLSSTELGGDYMYVIVDGEDIYAISGNDEVETWKSCYPWVAQEDGTYEVALCYLKDGSENAGDDMVYIKNMRVLQAEEIDTPTYIPFQAAATEDGLTYTYEPIFLNEKDGYYHVGSENGALLLVDMMNYTQFSDEQTLWNLVYDNQLKDGEGLLYDRMVTYFSYASNSALDGICTVNEELAQYLKIVEAQLGFDDQDENEWLKFCRYYQAYGTDNEQLVDPIKGLATFSAYEATLGKNVESNCFTYDKIIVPRGKLAKFVPSKSGVYRITSRNNTKNPVEGWIFREGREEPYTHEPAERMYYDEYNISMVYYMEKGEAYYIDIAYWDLYATGTIPYDIEYLGKELDLFVLCSQGYYTAAVDETGEIFYHTIAGGITPILNEKDGYYYQDLGKDANGKQRYGGKIYADFTGFTNLFGEPLTTIIERGGFDFGKTEQDDEILFYLKKYDYNVEETKAYLHTYWGEDYEANAAFYKVDDIFRGIYHGRGEDKTQQISKYLNKIITTGPVERHGCVPVDAELAELLQMLMEKFVFEDVGGAWTKLCFYYQHFGPDNG